MKGGTARVGVNRRQALRAIAAGGLGAAAATLWADNLAALAQAHAIDAHASAALATQDATTWAPKVLTRQQLATVGTLAELIIPTTETPGAKAALVDRFIDTILVAAARPDRDRFLSGLKWLDARSRALVGKAFIDASAAQQTDLLTRLSAEGPQATEARVGMEFFTAIKSMTITGYYTSEIGLRQELGDDGVLMLGVFEGCTHPEHQS
jgi:hypothetical protein